MGQGQSRLKYQQAVEELLAHPSLSPNDTFFWSKFWTLPVSADEVFEGVSPAAIRAIKQQNPGNLAILLHKAIGQLSAWIQRTTTAPDGKSGHEFASALNCVRLITRILPFLFEDPADGFVENVFWNNKLPVPVTQTNSPFIGNFTHTSPSLPRPNLPTLSAPASPSQPRANPPPAAAAPPPPEIVSIGSPRSPELSPAQIPLPNSPVPFGATTPESTSPQQVRDTEPVPFALSESENSQEPNTVATQENTNQPSAENGESAPQTNTDQPAESEEKPQNNSEEPRVEPVAESEQQGVDGQQTAVEAVQQEDRTPELATEVTTTPPRSPSPSPANVPLPQSPPVVSAPLPQEPVPRPSSTNPFEEEAAAAEPQTAAPTSTPAPAPTPALQQSQSVPQAESVPTTAPAPTPAPRVFEWHDSTLGGGDQPLAVRLLDTLLQLLFLPHYTVSAAPPSIQQIQAYQQSEDGALAHEQLPFYYFWAVGVGSETVISTPTTSTGGTTIWANRMETLKCLLACFSQTLYIPPEQARTHRNRWVEHVVCRQGYFSKALFCSLVNIVSSYDPVGWGVPYNHLMFRDEHEGVASVALQVLNVLLQYNQHHFQAHILQQQHRQFLLQQQQQQQLLQQQQSQTPGTPSPLQLSQPVQPPQLNGSPQQEHPPQQPLNESSGGSPQHTHAQQLLAHSMQLQRAQQQLLQAQQPLQSEQHQNFMLNTLADMKRNKDFQLIIDAFTRLMVNPIVATAARLPYSVKQLEWHHHILMLFWHMIEDNKKFLSHLITSDKCPHLLVPMLVFMYDNRKDASSLGVIQLCTFILLLLSGERDFAVTLNKPIVGARLPSDLPRPAIPYTHFDLLAIVAHRLITDGGASTPGAAAHLAPVRECILTALANASPFVKQIGMYAAMSLVKLFEKLSDPQVLFSSESVCRLVHLLLETFNNVIQYQFEGNPCLIYAILRSQNEFSKLAHIKIVQPPPALPVAAFQTPEQVQQSQAQQPPQSPQVASQPQAPQTPQQNPQSLPNQNTSNLPLQFIPTNEWLEAWKRTLPLDIILRMITMVSPKIQSVCTGSAAEEQPILQKLQNTTLVGLLPAPHPILIRKYQSNDATQTWLLSYLWGSIFLQQSHPPLFFGTKVKLFVLHTNP